LTVVRRQVRANASSSPATLFLIWASDVLEPETCFDGVEQSKPPVR
jgi:hypothetical protein